LGLVTKMPKELHAKLKREAHKKGLSGKAKAAYVYGTLENIKKKSKYQRTK